MKAFARFAEILYVEYFFNGLAILNMKFAN